MSDSANQAQPSNTTPKTPPSPPKGPDAVQFKSKDIGVETAKPQDIFAKQRKEAEKQKQAEKKTRKILIIVFSILGGLIVIGLLIWLIIWLVQINQPTEEPPSDDPTVIISGSDEEINNLVDAAQSAHDNQGDDQEAADAAADAIFEEALQNDADAQFTNQILLSQLQFYFANNRYEDIRNMFDSIDPSVLTPNQQATYYNAGYLAFYDTDPERAQEYMDLAYEASRAAGNGQGGDNA